jgi:hypothetical protein
LSNVSPALEGAASFNDDLAKGKVLGVRSRFVNASRAYLDGVHYCKQKMHPGALFILKIIRFLDKMFLKHVRMRNQQIDQLS